MSDMPTPSSRLLLRRDIPGFLREQLGIEISLSNLNKRASRGTGPKPCGYWGQRPLHAQSTVLEWATPLVTPEPSVRPSPGPGRPRKAQLIESGHSEAAVE